MYRDSYQIMYVQKRYMVVVSVATWYYLYICTYDMYVRATFSVERAIHVARWSSSPSNYLIENVKNRLKI